MTVYAVRFGNTNPQPAYDGDDTKDTLGALQVEDPVGTLVANVSPAGYLRAIGATPATANGGLQQFGAKLHVARGRYDFAVQGGAVSTIPLTGAAGIPSGALVIGGFISIPVTIPVGAGASIALGLNTTVDLLAAAAISGAPWSSTGVKALIPVLTAATAIVATAARDITATISAQVLTAGVFDVWVLYLN